VLVRTVVLVLVLVGVAAARPSSELTRAFQAGVDAYRLGKLDEAKRHLERARSLDPTLPGPHRFLAAVAQAEGDWQGCIDAARTALELNPRSQELADTRKLVEACRRSAGRAAYPEELGERAAIAVTTSVPGATVTIGGLAYGGTPLAPRTIPVGVHEVALDKAGYLSQQVTVNALAGVVTDVIVELEPAPEPAPAARAGKSAPAADRGSLAGKRHVAPVDVIAGRERRRRRGWILIGTGGVLVATAGVTGVLATGEDGTTRTALLAGAGASLVASAVTLGLGVWWVRQNRAPDPDAVPPVAVVPVEGGVVVTRGGRF